MTTAHRFTVGSRLTGLIDDAQRLADDLGDAAVPEAVASGLRAEAVLATLRLDGATIPEVPDAPGDDQQAPGVRTAAVDGDDPPTPGWHDTLRGATARACADGDEQVWALEHAGARAALASDDLAETLTIEPVGTLGELHRRLTRGLLAPGRAGTPRRTTQAVHDGSIGRILYFACTPSDVPAQLARLDAWLPRAAAAEHAVVVAGLLHHELLRIHPFEAANGRLARVAARLALRAGGLDPAQLAVFETVLAQDPLGYHTEVAATLRRRDHTIWLKRWAEAVTAALRSAARAAGLHAPDPGT